MEKTFKITLFFIIIVLSFYACNPSIKESGVITTIYPNYLILKELLPKNVELDYIVKPGMDPHRFSLNMQMAKKISDSKLIVLNGFGLDNFIGEKYKKHHVFLMSNFTKPLYSNMLKGNNPHIWLSPVEILKILPHLRAVLVNLFPQNKKIIIKRSNDFQQKLIVLINNLKKGLEPYKNMEIASYHPAWGYFARDFGMKKMIFIKTTPNEELSVKEMIKVINKIKQDNIKVLLSEVNIHDNLIQNLQKDIPNLRVVNIDPIGFIINARSYKELILKNEEIIINGLQKSNY